MGVVDLFNQIADNSFGFFQQVRTVADVITGEPVCLSLDDDYQASVRLMQRHSVRHFPVMNPDDQTLVGIVSDRDLARHRPPRLGTAAESDADARTLRDGVAQFMTRSPVWCTRECSPVHAITLMLDHRIDCVVVSPDGLILEGIVTPLDFIKTLLLYHRVCTRDVDLKRLRLVDLDLRDGVPLDEIFARGAQTVRDVMDKTIHTVSCEDRLCVAIERMQQEQNRHLIVVDDAQQYCGFLSDRDILRCLPTPSQRRPEDTERYHREFLFACDDNDVLRKRVDSVMQADARVASPDMLLRDAIHIFEDGETQGMPVVNSHTGKNEGILTTTAVLRVFRVVMQLGLWAGPTSETDRQLARGS